MSDARSVVVVFAMTVALAASPIAAAVSPVAAVDAGSAANSDATEAVGPATAPANLSAPAAEDGAREPTNDSGERRVELHEMNGDRQYDVPAGTAPTNADVPPGRYEVVTYLRGEVVDRYRTQIGSATDVSSLSTADQDVVVNQTVVEVGTETYEGSYRASDTVNITASALNTTGAIPRPVRNVDIWINVTRPDGTVDAHQVNTGTGSAHVRYDLTNKSDGEYDVRVSYGRVSTWWSGWANFYRGPQFEIQTGEADVHQIGEPMNLTLVATAGGRPQSNVTKELTITRPNGSTTSRTVTSGTDGTVTVTTTPSQNGSYRIKTESGFASVAVSEVVARTQAQGSTRGTSVVPGQQIAVSGIARQDGAAYADEPVEIGLYNWSSERYVQRNATRTNVRGQFETVIPIPEGTPATADLEVRLLQPGGERIATDMVNIHVRSGGSDGDVTQAPSLRIDQPGFGSDVTPGTETWARATLRDADGNPVANERVRLTVGLGLNGVVRNERVVRTNADGVANVSITVPEHAPIGSHLVVRAAASHNGTRLTDRGARDISQYVVTTDFSSYPYTHGTQEQIVVNATDTATDAPASGVPVVTTVGNSEFTTDVRSAGMVVTNESGRATHTFTLPTGWNEQFSYVSYGPALRGSHPGSTYIEDYDVSIGHVPYEVDAGEEVQITYATDSQEPVTAIVQVTERTRDATPIVQGVLHSSIAEPGETLTFEMPQEVVDGTEYQAQVVAVSDSGVVAQSTDFFEANASTRSGASPELTGTVRYANGTAAGAGQVRLARPNESVRVTATDSSGSFTFDNVTDGRTYDLRYVQRTGERRNLSRDGMADVYYAGDVTIDGDTSAGQITVPNASVLDVTVVDESGDPVSGATVEYIHGNPRDGLSHAAYEKRTDDSGCVESSPGEYGVEVTGETTVAVSPPDNETRWVQREYMRNLTVTGDRQVTVSLEEQPVPTVGVADGATVDEGASTTLSLDATGVDDADGVGAYNVTVNYDAATVSVDASSTDAFTVESSHDGDGTLDLVGHTDRQPGPNGTVSLASLTVTGAGEGTASLDVSVTKFADADGETLTHDTTAATVTVEETSSGGGSGNGGTGDNDDTDGTDGDTDNDGNDGGGAPPADDTETPTQTETPTPNGTVTPNGTETSTTTAIPDETETATTAATPDGTEAPTTTAETSASPTANESGGAITPESEVAQPTSSFESIFGLVAATGAVLLIGVLARQWI